MRQGTAYCDHTIAGLVVLRSVSARWVSYEKQPSKQHPSTASASAPASGYCPVSVPVLTDEQCRLGKGFVFALSREWSHPAKESKEHWTDETSEEKGQIVQTKKAQEKVWIGLLQYYIFRRIQFHKFSQMFISAFFYRHNNANDLLVVQVQLKIKAVFGVGVWLFPSLNGVG